MQVSEISTLVNGLRAETFCQQMTSMKCFLKSLNTSSQGGILTMFYHVDLETVSTPQPVSRISWKSSRLKRKLSTPFLLSVNP